MLPGANYLISWKYRIAAVCVAAILAFSLLELWAGGIRFMKLVTHIAQQIAEQEMAAEPEAAPPAPETPGVVPVGILPEEPAQP